jgi:hypothetical protein
MEVAKREHLEWAIQSRARNQLCSLRLLGLFHDYPTFWKTRKYAQAAQDLTAVAFSLWRAAFLAQKTGRREEVFAHAKTFLERVIEDNAISYPSDKTSREWTFNYYARNARSSLETLYNCWPDICQKYVVVTRTATDRWDYCQQLLEDAVDKFDAHLKSRSLAKTPKRLPGVKSKHQKRAIVRQLTLAGRKSTTTKSK